MPHKQKVDGSNPSSRNHKTHTAKLCGIILAFLRVRHTRLDKLNRNAAIEKRISELLPIFYIKEPQTREPHRSNPAVRLEVIGYLFPYF